MISFSDAGFQFADGSILGSAKYQFGFKNKFINGAMQINQRGAASTTANATYLVDRWLLASTNAFTTLSLVTDGTVSLVGNNHLLMNTNTVLASPAVSDFSLTSHRFEGVNVADSKFGLATAKTITISFRARASVAGVYTLAVRNGANNRSYVVPITMTTGVATYTVTIAGDTAGTWATDNTTGLEVSLCFTANTAGTFTTPNANVWQAGNFIAHSTQSNGLDTLNRNIAASDFQLELGANATPFETRSYSVETALCQRYYEIITLPAQASGNTSYAYFKVSKRATATLVYISGATGANLVAIDTTSVGQGSYVGTGGQTTWSASAEL